MTTNTNAALRSAAESALEALEILNGIDTETESVTIHVSDEIAALRAALTTAAPQPCDIIADAVRVPLDSLHADASYLIGRLQRGTMTASRVVEVIRERIDAAKAALTTAAAVPATVVGEKFQRAWVQLDQLPGTMMVGPEGRFGPIPASTSAWITTSEEERDRCLSAGKPMLEVWLAAAPKAAQAQAAVAGLGQETCQSCQGNGEIVTNWERYKHPSPGDRGDEAVAECQDCDGRGVVDAAPTTQATPQPAAQQGDELPREDFAWLVVQEACETEPADEDDPECIRILRRDLKSAVLSAFLRHDAAHPAAPVAQGDAMTYEREHAIRQGHEIASSDAYFQARPQIDGLDRRNVFRAGFERGWDAARSQAKEGDRDMTVDVHALLREASEQKAARAEQLPTEQDCIRMMVQCRLRLLDLGWMSGEYAPKDRTIEGINAGWAGPAEYQHLGAGWFIAESGDWWPAPPPLVFRGIQEQPHD